MKIFTVIAAACLFTISAASAQLNYAAAERLKMPKSNQQTESSLKSVLQGIESKYGVSIIYLDELIEKKVPEILAFTNLDADLKKVLEPEGLSFKKITDKQIAIVKLPKATPEASLRSAKSNSATLSPPRLIKGKVLSTADNTPLEGATISIKGSTIKTVSNNRGEFEISVEKGDILLVNFLGFVSNQIVIDDQQSLIITLDANSKSMEEVVIIGSRNSVARTNVERPVPVDVFTAKEIQKTGQTELGQMIHFSAPSFNSTKHGISNVTSYVDPATLRGLGPDQTLVLINGKRRHQSAALNVNNVVGRGTVGTDLNVIPTGAIERVEILRDGAAAQYGSDAIAGIVNLQLKRSATGGSASAHYGLTKKGDGKTFEQFVNFGLPLGKQGGFFNTTLQAHRNDPTDRSAPFNGKVYNSNQAKDDSIINARQFNRQIAGTKYGTAKNTSGIAFYNAGIPLSDKWTAYSFGGYSYKRVTAYGFFRPPSNSKRAVLSIYPNGYSPVFPATLQDVSNTVGFKGTIGSWKMDLSNTYGQNHIALFSNNTVNPSYGDSSPTSFYGGALKFGQNSTNVDFSKSLETKAIKSLSVAMGAEYRMENYKIEQGDDPSWRKGKLINTDVGASGREGFADVNAVNKSRNNIGVYADAESDINDKLLFTAAARFENYSDFGSNLSGKLSARYKFFKALSVRGSINRGFRAPSMHQLYYSNNADAQWLTINSVFDAYPIGHLRNDNKYVQALGVGQLKAETSLDYNAGLTLQLGSDLSMTVDAYQIDIKDRIVISAQLDATSAALKPIFTGSGYALVQFFSNALDTRTKGIDVVSTYRKKFSTENEITISGALMVNQTKLHGAIRTPSILSGLGSDLIDRSMLGLIEVAQPRNKVIGSVTYKYKGVEALVRATRFGEVIARQNNPAQDQTFGAKIISDASLAFTLSPKISLTIGANNLLNVYPDKIDLVALTGSGQTPYTRFTSQFGFMGAYYYTSMRIGF